MLGGKDPHNLPPGWRVIIPWGSIAPIDGVLLVQLSDMTLDIRQIAGALGAEVHGIDLAVGLSGPVAEALRTAFLCHKVLFFRDQALSPESHLAVARLFGEPDIYPFIEGLPEAPEVIDIVKAEKDTLNFGGGWHSDTAYLERPALGTMLYALDVPEAGGDTQFANTQLAYEGLSDGLKCTIDGLIGVNSSEIGYLGGRAAGMGRIAGMSNAYVKDSAGYQANHPIVRTHPDTGAKCLYVSRAHTARFQGMTEEESRPLIEYLSIHITRPEFTCRFRWAMGSVAVWDNRTTQHAALNDYHGKRRHMRRVTLKGDRPK